MNNEFYINTYIKQSFHRHDKTSMYSNSYCKEVLRKLRKNSYKDEYIVCCAKCNYIFSTLSKDTILELYKKAITIVI